VVPNVFFQDFISRTVKITTSKKFRHDELNLYARPREIEKEAVYHNSFIIHYSKFNLVVYGGS